jgi:hypothetical protein
VTLEYVAGANTRSMRIKPELLLKASSRFLILRLLTHFDAAPPNQQ